MSSSLALIPDSSDEHVPYGTVLFAMPAPERALREFNFAIDLDGNLAIAHAYVGVLKFLLGRVGNPRSCRDSDAARPARSIPTSSGFFHQSRDAYLLRVVYGIESLRKRVEINPNRGHSHFVLAGALALAGAARGGSRSLCCRLASRAQIHDRQVPCRSAK